LFMRRMCFFPPVLLFLSILFSWSARAGDEWLPIDPAELKMTSEPLALGAPAIYLYRQVDREDKLTASSEYNYLRIKILSEAGREFGNIEIPFARGRYSVSRIRARTVHPDGSIVKFEGKVYENTIEKSRSVKYLAKTFSMPEVTVGSIVEYQFYYDYSDYYLFDSRWILSERLFTKQAKFSLKRYVEKQYSAPDWNVRWVWPAGLPAGTKPPEEEGANKVIRMETNNIPAFQTEEYMPPEDELKMRVNFIYYEGAMDFNPDKYWANIGKKENGHAEEFVNKHKAMEQAVAQIVSPNDAPMVKLQKIYARTQQVRNTTYEESKTEEEQKRDKLNSASNVEELWKNQYGSKGQITWLFMGLVRAAGFSATPCVVSSRDKYFFHKERLNSQELNANVVLVKLDGKDLYFDPGAAFAPFGLLPWEETGVLGLKLDKDGGKWITTEVPASDASRIERKGELKLLEDGSLEGKLIVTWTGLAGMSRRLDERNEDETSRKKFLENEVKESVGAASEPELTNAPDWKSSDQPLKAEFTLKVPGFATSAGRKALLPVSLFSADEKRVFEHADRVYPVYYSYPFKKVDDIRIDLPLNFKIATLPQPMDEDVKVAEYKLSAENQKGDLQVRREFRVDLLVVPKESYAALRGFYQMMRTEDDKQIVLQPGGASASN
jgi:Domain of Unknown Function with PDB structure (DUF3857)